MKYSNILFGLAAFCGIGSFVSCDVNDEFYDELDKKEEVILVEELEYTLVEKDYEFFKSDEDEVKNKIASYKNFSNSVLVSQYLPEFLNDKYPYVDKGSTAAVTYNFYQGGLSYIYDLKDYLEVLASMEAYELTSDDYDSMGEESGQPGRYDNFSNSTPAEDYLPAFLLQKYPEAESGDEVYLTYKFYDGGVSTINEFWAFDGTVWVKIEKELPEVPDVPADVTVYELTAEDYDSMGTASGQPGKYNNFSSSIPANQYLPTLFTIKYPYAKEGNKVAVIYKFYNGSETEQEIVQYAFDGAAWNEYSKVVAQTSNFKYTGDTWAFVPPIKFIKSEMDFTTEYVLTDDDYSFVGNGKYKNFDVREGKDEENEQVRIDKITKILKNNFDIALGDVYKVTYKVYNGQNEDWTLNLEAVEDN